ncbi:hypothetical protein [Candidatus Anaplasma sp. TIGMIC]|uniref:hypothetical protein n=1 Tax=Candidatus Anaplasma sp. TIGMIC TaxID=3020713 RepID=UPI00232E1979|nr:hypothetical protein [Candidatus Anaplasma sp. TIGMIC]
MPCLGHLVCYELKEYLTLAIVSLLRYMHEVERVCILLTSRHTRVYPCNKVPVCMSRSYV